MTRRIPALLLLLLPFAAAQDELVPGTHRPPAVGEVAKPLETVYWYDLGSESAAPVLADWRGEVVLVHTWGYYCGPCVKTGVPLVVDLMRANAGRGLRALSITVAIGDGQPDDHFVKVGREMGMTHALGITDGYGAMTPYLNMDVNKGLTWCFVIARDGGVRFAGDPSIDTEEYLEAVRAALAEEPAPALDEGMPAELARAIARYVDGELGAAREELAKVEKRYAKKRDSEEVGRVLEAARGLAARIDAFESELLARLEAGAAEAQAAEWVAASALLSARFAKGASAKRVKELERGLSGDFAAEVARWRAWADLCAARPALFPARRDERTCERYARELARYVEDAPADRPGLEEARALLAAFEGG